MADVDTGQTFENLGYEKSRFSRIIEEGLGVAQLLTPAFGRARMKI